MRFLVKKITYSEAPKSPILGTLIFRIPRIGAGGLDRFFKGNLLSECLTFLCKIHAFLQAFSTLFV